MDKRAWQRGHVIIIPLRRKDISHVAPGFSTACAYATPKQRGDFIIEDVAFFRGRPGPADCFSHGVDCLANIFGIRRNFQRRHRPPDGFAQRHIVVHRGLKAVDRVVAIALLTRKPARSGRPERHDCDSSADGSKGSHLSPSTRVLIEIAMAVPVRSCCHRAAE